MPNVRTDAERQALRVEAERRARAGVSRTEISRALNVPLSTIAYWALQDEWRLRDLRAGRSEETARLANEEIARHRAQEDENARRAEEVAAQAAEWAADTPAAASGGEVSPEHFTMGMVQALIRQGRLDEACRMARTSYLLVQTVDRMEAREQRLKAAEGDRARGTTAEISESEKRREEHERVRRKLDGLIADLDDDLREKGMIPCAECGQLCWPNGRTEEDGGEGGEAEGSDAL